MKRIFLFSILFFLLFFLKASAKETKIKNTLLHHRLSSQFSLEKLAWSNTSAEKQKGAMLEEEKEKSPAKAVLYSLLLPGAGQIYAGSQIRGKIFLGTEASVWAGFISFRFYGSWLKKEYKTYAAVHANANISGKSDDFFEDLTYYENRDEFNKLAPLYFGKGTTIYAETDFWNWQWESREAQKHFREIRNRSKSAYRRGLYMIGLALANRLISAVDAFRTAKIYNHKKSLEISKVKIDFDVNPFGKNPHLTILLSRQF